MLSDDEQRIWNDIVLFYDVEQPGGVEQRSPRRNPGGLEDLPAAAAAGCWITIMLVLFGAVTAGLAVGGVTALGWLLWRYRPLSTPAVRAVPSPARGASGTAGGETPAFGDAPRSWLRSGAQDAGWLGDRREEGQSG